MDRAEFLEFVLGSRSDIIVETWDLRTPPVASRVTLPFADMVHLSGDEAFWLPENGKIQSLVSDSDEREPVLPPSVRIETSLGRFNSYWRFAEALSRKEAEVLLGYLDPMSPPRLTQTFRLPGTTSAKHGEPFTCRIADASGHIYSAAHVFGLALPAQTVPPIDLAWARSPGPFEAGNTKQALLWLQKKGNENAAIGKSTRALLEKKEHDPRSLMLRLIKGGLTEKEAIWCAEAAVGNPFRHWQYGAKEELAKMLVIRRTAAGDTSIAATIHGIRSNKGDHSKPFVIRDKMAKRAIADFGENATVLQATDGTRWAIDRHSGTAMEMVEGSEPINHYIMRRYGINPVDVDHRHLLKEMILMASGRPATAEATAISFYDKDASRMLVSFGGREVAVLTADGMDLQENGASGIIFKPVPRADPLATKLLPVDRALQDRGSAWWDRILPLSHLANLTRGDPEEISALLHVWTIFFLFRNIAASRPLLIALGAAGCLSGETQLLVNRGKRHSGRSYSLSDLYDMLSGKRRHNGRIWDPSIPTAVLSQKDGKILYRRIKRVVRSGMKTTFTVKIDGHEPFRATMDHRFLSPEGWTQLKNLSVGDLVATGEIVPASGQKRPHHHRRTVRARFHPNARQKAVSWVRESGERKERLYPSIYYAWAVVESRMNGITTDEFLDIVQNDEEQAKTLMYLPDGANVHHEDEDPENNELTNLKVLTKKEHDRLHGEKDASLHFGNHMKPEFRAITAIDRFGEEDTYDIEMEDGEAPNFLVNGVIVHNSGKTTMSKKLHLLFYGNGVKLFEVKSQDWWTTTVSNYPLALFDNVDTPTPWWLPPALALSITPTDATKRSLYSNNTPYTMRMDAMVGLSSHDAAFLKDDVIDRAILVQSRRIENEDRLEEQPMMDAILRDREELLAGLMADVVRVLRTPRPAAVQGSAIRIVDFNAIGRWIARGIDKEDAFTSAIGTLSVHQQAKVLEEDIALVMALEDMQRMSPLATEWCTHTQLWAELIGLADDNGESLRSQYKNGQTFGRKLIAIYTQLRDAIGLQMKDDAAHGWKVFSVGRPKKPKKEPTE